MPDDLGLLGVILYLMVTELFKLIKVIVSKLSGKEGTMEKHIDNLSRQHNVFDEDGVPVWYVRSSLERSIDELSHAVKEQNQLFNRVLMERQTKSA